LNKFNLGFEFEFEFLGIEFEFEFLLTDSYFLKNKILK